VSLLRSRLAILDTETSGFPSNPSASVIDVAGVILDTDGAEVASFATLVQPLGWGPWADGATAIHGLRLADVQDAPKPADVSGDLAEWLSLHHCRYVTAYNVGFDRPMLARMGFPANGPRWADCIMERAGRIMGPAGALRPADPTHPRFDPAFPWLWPPLSPRPESDGRPVSACEFFGVDPVTPAHRAASDAATAARVLLAILARRS